MHFTFVMEGYLLDPSNDLIVGPLVQTYLLSRELLRRGIRVSYISYSSRYSAPSRTVEEGMEILRLPIRILPMRLDELVTAPKVARLLGELRPDVVYTRGRSSVPAAASRWARRAGALSIWCAARDRDFNGAAYVKMKMRQLPLPARPLAAAAYHLTMNLLFERGVRRTDLIFVQNQFQLEMARGMFPDQPVALLPSAAEPVEPEASRRECFELMWVGQIKGEKRPELFLELAGQLSDLPVELTMCGPVLDNRYLAAIEATAANNPRFRYLGALSYAEAAGRIAGATILVNTSVSEGFPNTYLQAWSAGNPVITLACDPSDLIWTLELGRVSRTIDRMAADIRELWADRPRLERIGREARGYVERNHAVRAVADRILDGLARVRPLPGAPASDDDMFQYRPGEEQLSG